MAPHGFHRGQAVYTVAGWWTRLDAGPAGRGPRDRPASTGGSPSCGGTSTHDGEDDRSSSATDPEIRQLTQYAGLIVADEPRAEVTTVTEYAESA